jgi:hypothetical protein
MLDDLEKLIMVRRGQLSYHPALFKSKVFDLVVGDMLDEIKEKTGRIYELTAIEEKHLLRIEREQK